MIHVYYAPPSIYGRKVLAVLEEKGLDYEIQRLSFSQQDHLKPEYLKINPNGEIPALVDDSFVVYESTAIIEYLNDEYPEPPLMPEDSSARAQVRMIEDYCDLHLYPVLVKCYVKKFLRKEALTDADKNAVAQGLKRIEAYLEKQPYVAGKFSLADCAVMSALATFEALELQSLASSAKPFQDYLQRLKGRPGFKGASMIRLEPAMA